MSDHHHHDHHGDHPGFDPERLKAMHERRREHMPPEDALSELIARPDMKVVDIGCGVGYFAIPMAQRLEKGTVYAIDLQENMIEATREAATEAGLENITLLVAPSTALPLEDSSVDAVLMAMVFHDLHEQAESLEEAKRILKPGGTLYFVEWDRIESDFGPPMEIRIRPDELSSQVEAAGFSIVNLRRGRADSPVYYLRAAAPTQ